MKTFILLLLGLFSHSVFAETDAHGGSDVGGGMGVVCRDPQGEISSVELLDLWEARVIYGRTIELSPDPVAAQVAVGVDRLKDSIDAHLSCVRNGGGTTKCGAEFVADSLKFSAERFLSPVDYPNLRRLRGVHLEKTKDSFEVVTPKDCEIEQIVRFQDTQHGGFILVNQDLVDRMNPTNQAALYLHEALYRLLRSEGQEKSSIRVRRSIGYVFAGGVFEPWEAHLPKRRYLCGDGRNDAIYLFEAGGGMATMQIGSVAGLRTIGVPLYGSGVHTKVENLFFQPSIWSVTQTLGYVASFDYSALVEIGGSVSNGKPQIQVGMIEAPDQVGPFPTKTLACRLEELP